LVVRGGLDRDGMAADADDGDAGHATETYMWPSYAPDGRLPSESNSLSRGELPDSGVTFDRVDLGDDP
jgi:hypothetical protein